MRCPPIRGRRPGSGGPAVRCPAVRCPVTWCRRPGSGGPAGWCPPVQRPPVWCPARPASSRLLSGVQPAGVRPSDRTRLSPPTLDGRWDQAGAAGGNRHRRNRSRSRWAAVPSSGPVDGPAGLGRAALPRSHVGRGVVGGLAGWVRAAAAALDRLSDQAGQAGGRSARGWRRRGGHGSRLQREVAAAAAWLPSWAGWATTVGGGHGACRPGGRVRRGRWACRRGWACGPSAAQAGSGRSRVAAGSALTCGVGWWACQDLNLGPHPYQAHARGCVHAGRDGDCQLTGGAGVTVVVRWVLRLSVRCGTQVARSDLPGCLQASGGGSQPGQGRREAIAEGCERERAPVT
jgi:hypothetical protein